MVGLLGRVIRSSQCLYLHRTTQHKKTRTNIHAISGIRTHNSVYERSRPAPETARPLDRLYFSLQYGKKPIIRSDDYCVVQLKAGHSSYSCARHCLVHFHLQWFIMITHCKWKFENSSCLISGSDSTHTVSGCLALCLMWSNHEIVNFTYIADFVSGFRGSLRPHI
jgi:hypothetical protein